MRFLSGECTDMQSEWVLAYASQYKEKYFWNEELGKLPETVRGEILTCLIWLTEEAGGVAQLSFNEEGEPRLDSWCEEGDLGYDHVSAALLMHEIERDHAETLEQLKVWYRARTGLSS